MQGKEHGIGNCRTFRRDFRSAIAGPLIIIFFLVLKMQIIFATTFPGDIEALIHIKAAIDPVAMCATHTRKRDGTNKVCHETPTWTICCSDPLPERKNYGMSRPPAHICA
ncbi:hypothetical protein O6H91_01G078800 [Diphasiastrum complanatum]|uniref:Uncharacterized protein n=1 Tax=Diphasiastrum complanatum TaxID=34168 RepID=A0ACC2EST0_DIPCM|nr:hypothetical protein O6H91_01G078800 [Diphasiastrum complanatum]